MDTRQTDKMNNAIDETGLRRTTSDHVEWKKDHSQYPRNWSPYRKTYDTAIIVFFEFYTLSLVPLYKKNSNAANHRIELSLAPLGYADPGTAREIK
jgi:hypothetical protein